MSTLLLIYAVVITLELILSLVMAVILFLIIAPPGASGRPTERTPETGGQRQLSPTVNGALRDAFSSLSRGDNDMSTIVHARHMLAQYAEHHRTESAPAAE